jgi:adenine-specific DNA-methyltransferase
MISKKTELSYEQKTENCFEEAKTHHILLKENESLDINNSAGKHHNILIEGENYHALKVLQYTHTGKIDVIYIDPPYNTGNKDFVYNDSFIDEEDAWRHAKWLSMMRVRLELARSLLNERGTIFISIDDNEQHRLRCLCDQIFGEQNFIAQLIWKNKFNGGYDAQFITTEHEYILVYAKNIEHAHLNYVPFNVEDDKAYKFEDEYVATRGKFKIMNLDDKSLKYSESLDFEIIAPNGSKISPANCWRWGKDKVAWGITNGFLQFVEVGNSWRVNKKQYQYCDNDGNPLVRAYPLRSIIDGVSNTNSGNEIKELFGDKTVFQYAKPVELIKRLLSVSTQKDSIILDFFAGSGTTGQAVAELNKVDDGHRQFILVTNNDKSDKLLKGICAQVTHPRLVKTIGTENLKYFKVASIKKNGKFDSNYIDQLTYDNPLLPILKLQYETFEEVESTKQYIILANHDKSFCLGVWHKGIGANGPDFKKKMNKLGKNKILICRDSTYPKDYFTISNRL